MFVVSVTFLSLLYWRCDATVLDIHIPLRSTEHNTNDDKCCPYNQALLWNLRLRQQQQQQHEQNIDGDGDPKQKQPAEFVDFFSLHTPHVTLYLADFDLETKTNAATPAAAHGKTTPPALNQTKLHALIKAVTSTVSAFDPCDVVLSGGVVEAGSYTMLNVQRTPCLQGLSDAVVHNTKEFVRFPAVVPDWAKDDPQKVRNVVRYGSPNVFQDFHPHVTVGYLEEEEGRASPVVTGRTPNMVVPAGCSQAGAYVSLGRTDKGGTVLQGSIVDVKVTVITPAPGKTQQGKTIPKKKCTGKGGKETKCPPPKTIQGSIVDAKVAGNGPQSIIDHVRAKLN